MSTSSTSSDGRNHQVYISVRREDPSKYVIDMIDRSLDIRGLRTFKDQNQLIRNRRGTEIGDELREAIRMSKISVVLFSKDYFASSWCLEELVMIMDCRKKNGLIVLPIFYDMDPSDIRKLRGFAAKVVGIQKVGSFWRRRWSDALLQAANLCGWDHRGNNRIESQLVGKVVEDILHKRIPTNLNISIYPLRYDTCDVYLNLFLQMGFDNVIIVGICGQSRMGKTTIAKSIYTQIFYTFEGSCFLTNVGKIAKQPNGLVYLQEKLLSDILFESDIKIENPDIGMTLIETKLFTKRVLIVLDGVDDSEQLVALVGRRSWFGLGSKIIITTRDVELLDMFGVDQVFMAQGLPLPFNLQVKWEEYQQSRRRVAGLKAYMENLTQLSQTSEKIIWEDHRQSHREIAGLKAYMENLNQSANKKVRYLEDYLQRERQKNAMQAQVISQMEELRVREGLTALTA